MKKIVISKYALSQLKNKYEHGASSYDLAKECGISQNTILRRLHKMGVALRRTRAIIPDTTINKIASDYVSNPSQSLSTISHKYGISREGLAYRFRQKNIKVRSSAEMTSFENKKRSKKIDLTRPLDENFAYVLGVMFGDGYLSKEGIHLSCIDEDFAIIFASAISKWIGLHCSSRHYFHKKSKLNLYRVDFYSKELFPWFIDKFGSFYCKEFTVPLEFIGRQSDGFAHQFIRGLYDSEATWSLQFGIANFKAIHQIRQLLISLGFHPTNVVKSGTMYYIGINSYLDRKKYYEEIGLSILRKDMKLKEWLGNHTDIHTSRLINIKKAQEANRIRNI